MDAHSEENSHLAWSEDGLGRKNGTWLPPGAVVTLPSKNSALRMTVSLTV
jgi:hypothetical protein